MTWFLKCPPSDFRSEGRFISPRPSVNFGRPLQRVLQLLKAEILAARDVEDRRLAATAEFGSIRNFRGKVVWNNDRPMLIGMNEIVRAHRHPGDAHLAAKAFRMNPGVGRPDRSGQRLEAWRPLRDVANRAVGDD